MSEALPTPAEIAVEVTKRDISDILFLQECQPFNRYFMRRIREKKVAIERRFRGDPPAKCDAAEREILRRLLDEYDVIERLLDSDFEACKMTVENEAHEKAEKTYQAHYEEGTKPEPGFAAMS